MWMRRASLSLALLTLAAAHARPEDVDPEPSFVNALRGKWQQVSRVEDGQPSDADLIRNRTITFEKDKYVLRDGDRVGSELSFVLDRSKRPMHFDVTFLPNKDRTVKGIIKYEKGVLTVCMSDQGGDRPDKFESKAGDGRILASYKKAKK